jgi:3-oxoacyl-[acyl-carrier protein] reductase
MVILITGASRGIGREIAITLSKEGHKIIANYNKSEEQAKELEKQNTNIEIFKADVSKRNEVQNMVQEIIKKYGKIDVLINNAGISENKLFTNVTDEDWNRMINTNLYSAFCVSQEVIPYMIHEKNGCIINISSVWGIVGSSCETIYSIAKAGIDGMTKSLAKELGPSNIRVNSIAPGIIDTEMNKNLTDEDIKNIKEEIPLEKIGKKIDIARCIMWLINDEYTTGQVISINGGWVIT